MWLVWGKIMILYTQNLLVPLSSALLVNQLDSINDKLPGLLVRAIRHFTTYLVLNQTQAEIKVIQLLGSLARVNFCLSAARTVTA